MTKPKSLLPLLLLFSALSFAQQPAPKNLDSVTVKADTKFSLTRKESGRPVIKITREDIDRQAASSIADLLNQYAGIEINGARSNAGQNLSYLIRGGATRQASFLIDGAQVGDAGFISSQFDLRLLDLAQVEEIEILKGASSSLYGANASTAVINIKLREEYKKNWNLSASFFTGTNQSAEDQDYEMNKVNTSFYLSGRGDAGLTYGIGLGYHGTDGLSAVEPLDGSDAVSDKFEKLNLIGRIGYDNQKDFKITSYVSFDEFQNNYDGFDFTDQPFNSYNRQWRWGTNMLWKPTEKLEIVYNDVSTHTRRDNRDGLPSRFNADGYSLDVYGRYNWTVGDHTVKTLAGFNYRRDQFESFQVPFGGDELEQLLRKEDVLTQIYDPYVNVLLNTDFGLNLNIGGRYHGHENYDGEFLYHINPSFILPIEEIDMKLFANYSTAYITPSLFQLYSPQFGNAALEPEENATLEGGLELNAGKMRVIATGFIRYESNLVVFTRIDPDNLTDQYINLDEDFTARGIEITGEYTAEKYRLSANYTFIEREEFVPLRIPKHKVNASASYTILPRTNATLRYQFNDIRADRFFDPISFDDTATTLSSFHLLDVDFTHKLKDEPLTLFAGVQNVLNEDYQELFGYQTRGRNIRLGLRVNL